MTFSLSSMSRITFSARGSRNRTLRLFASFRDPETQDRLALAPPAFRDKAALIQFGSWDPMKQQGWHERWAKEIPDSEVRIIPHVAHFTFEGGPEATVANFREWWAAVERREGVSLQAARAAAPGPGQSISA
jgi:pimeloyl-ACP methyl ester carboxylesterase